MKELGQATVGIVSDTAKDQFEALFFVAAYSYLFPYGVGCPDLRRQPRDRRQSHAPTVDFGDDWSKLLMQRAEGQFRRDLTLPFALWNMVFRTIINIGHKLHGESMGAVIGAARRNVEGESHTVEDFMEATMGILSALQGNYKTVGGATVNVGGDLAKVSQTTGLSGLAQRMIHSMRATCRNIEGSPKLYHP